MPPSELRSTTLVLDFFVHGILLCMEGIPNQIEYNEEMLEVDIKAYADKYAAGGSDRLEGLSGLQLFVPYQNNFYRLPKLLAGYVEGREEQFPKETQLVKDFQEAAQRINFDLEELKEFGRPTFSDDQLEKLKSLWIEMIKMGHSRLDLIG